MTEFRYAIVETGVVTNCVMADDSNPPVNGVPSDTALIGWTYNGHDFFPPPVPVDVLWDQLRAECKRRIARCDLHDAIVARPNSPQARYLQALRDLPGKTTDPANPVYPDAPTESEKSAWAEFKAIVGREADDLLKQGKSSEALIRIYQNIGALN